MFKIIAIVIALLIAGVLILAAMQPDVFRVQRSVTIKAAPDKVFAIINDFHQWGAWSPFEKLDPDMKRVMSGPVAGKGAVYQWEGNGKAGAGRMEITESTPASRVLIKLDFTKPFTANNVAEFDLESSGDTTNVTWAMYGPTPFLGKIVHVFFNMDKMVGGDFENGLNNLKTLSEGDKKPASPLT